MSKDKDTLASVLETMLNNSKRLVQVQEEHEKQVLHQKNRLLDIKDRIKTIIRTISGQYDLEVSSEIDQETWLELMGKGQDPKNTWFIRTEHDPETKQVIRRTAHIPEKILEANEDIARGKAAHEAGHVAITRYGEFVPQEVEEELGFPLLLATLEERATDQSIRNRLVGAGHWIDKARQADIEEVENQANLKSVPDFFQLANLIVYEPHLKNKKLFSEAARSLYEEVSQDVSRFENCLPDEDDSEKEILNQAIKRYKIAYLDIWPKVKSLLEKNLEPETKKDNKEEKDKEKKGQDKPDPETEEKESESAKEKEKTEKEKFKRRRKRTSKEEEKTGEENKDKNESAQEEREQKAAGSSQTLSEKNREKSEKEKTTTDPLASARQERREYLKRLEKEMIERFSGKLYQKNKNEKEEREEEREEGMKHKSKSELELLEIEKRLRELEETDRNIYDKTYSQINIYERTLYQELEAIFTPNIKATSRLKSSGNRINLPAVFRWDSARKAGARSVDSKIFESIHIPEKKDYAISILVDLSGSMRSYGKIEESFKTVILLAETLNRLGLRFEINGFQDTLIRFKDFDKKLDHSLRNNLCGMVYEVIDENPGGNNFSSYNDDGPCLHAASQSLAKEAAKEKFLLVISDGLPAGSYSDEDDLTNEIERISKQSDQKLIGLGLGEDTEHVKDFYPVSIANISVEQLSEVLSDLLKEIISNPDKFN